jgi:hypothetical protein
MRLGFGLGGALLCELLFKVEDALTQLRIFGFEGHGTRSGDWAFDQDSTQGLTRYTPRE